MSSIPTDSGPDKPKIEENLREIKLSPKQESPVVQGIASSSQKSFATIDEDYKSQSFKSPDDPPLSSRLDELGRKLDKVKELEKVLTPKWIELANLKQNAETNKKEIAELEHFLRSKYGDDPDMADPMIHYKLNSQIEKLSKQATEILQSKKSASPSPKIEPDSPKIPPESPKTPHQSPKTPPESPKIPPESPKIESAQEIEISKEEEIEEEGAVEPKSRTLASYQAQYKNMNPGLYQQISQEIKVVEWELSKLTIDKQALLSSQSPKEADLKEIDDQIKETEDKLEFLNRKQSSYVCMHRMRDSDTSNEIKEKAVNFFIERDETPPIPTPKIFKEKKD